MFKRIALGLTLAGILATGGAATLEEQLPATIAACRHDQHSTGQDRTRRDQAIVLAKAINAAQAASVRRTQSYQPLANLPNLPDVPAGFRLNLFADGQGYLFAIKDTLDPCRFAVFSDSAGLLYEKSAYTAPVIAR